MNFWERWSCAMGIIWFFQHWKGIQDQTNLELVVISLKPRLFVNLNWIVCVTNVGRIWMNLESAPRKEEEKHGKLVKLIIVTTLVHSWFIGLRARVDASELFLSVFVAWCANTGHPWVHMRFPWILSNYCTGWCMECWGDDLLMYHT